MSHIKITLPVVVLATALFWVGCNKSPEPRCVEESIDLTVNQTQLEADLEEIDLYLEEYEIEAEEETELGSGIRYVINNPGDGSRATYCSAVFVEYTGILMSDSTIFDETDLTTGARGFYLNGLINAWQVGIPLIEVGGSITLYVPSGYAYGNNAVGDIPANANLIFHIDLVAVQ